MGYMSYREKQIVMKQVQAGNIIILYLNNTIKNSLCLWKIKETETIKMSNKNISTQIYLSHSIPHRIRIFPENMSQHKHCADTQHQFRSKLCISQSIQREEMI